MWFLDVCIPPLLLIRCRSTGLDRSHSRPQLVSGPRRVGSCCAYDKNGRVFAFSCLPACMRACLRHANPMLTNLCCVWIGFRPRCTIAIAAADESYTNLIAPHQRVQPVSGLVCLYFLLLIHSRRFRFHLLAGACLPSSLNIITSCESS